MIHKLFLIYFNPKFLFRFDLLLFHSCIFQASDNCSICMFHTNLQYWNTGTGPVADCGVQICINQVTSRNLKIFSSTLRIWAHELAPLNSSGFCFAMQYSKAFFKIVYHFKGGYGMYSKRTRRQLKSRWQKNSNFTVVLLLFKPCMVPTY